MIEQTMPPQKQSQPGRQHVMDPAPGVGWSYRPASKLEGRAALGTGGDSRGGRSVAVPLPKEGADVAIVYLEETQDADNGGQVING